MCYTAAQSQLPRERTQRSVPALSPPPVAPGNHGEVMLSDVATTDLDLRQLRHHTKNTMQRIIGLIGESAALKTNPEGEAITRELERRIALSVDISDALFGLTDAPGSMAIRLRQLAGGMVDLMRDTDQSIRIGVFIRGCCPDHLRETVVRTAHELIGNAMKHGMKGRPSGRITVRLVTDNQSTRLMIVDNGWGFNGSARDGEGLSLARGFATRLGGSLLLEGADGTVATLELPNWD